MDEKGDSAVAMDDDELENGEQSEIPDTDREGMVADAPAKPVASWTMSERIAEHSGEKLLADGSKGRISIKEKLAEMKEKASGQKLPEKSELKGKGKEESL